MDRRLEEWKSVAREILDPKEREKKYSYKNRAQIFTELTIVAKTLPARRVCPTITPDEFIVFNSIVKESFPSERSPAVLEEHVRYFSETISGISGFLRQEEREPIYPGPYNKERLEATCEDMAWGLASLAGRSDLPDIQKAALAEIAKLKATLHVNKSGNNIGKKALAVFSVKEKFPLTSFNVLHESMGNSIFENPFQEIETKDLEVQLQVRDGCIFPLEWNPSFTWLALRFPYAAEIIIRQSGQDDIIINTHQVREWVVSNESVEKSYRLTKPVDLHEFYSVSGKTSTKEEVQLLESGKSVSHNPFGFTLGLRRG